MKNKRMNESFLKRPRDLFEIQLLRLTAGFTKPLAYALRGRLQLPSQIPLDFCIMYCDWLQHCNRPQSRK